MAKGLEDTAHYRHSVLTALNEVGSDPNNPRDDALSRFHSLTRGRAARGDLSLTPLSTHDTKRSEDARARLLALSEHADEWEALLRDATELLDRACRPPCRLRPEIIIFLLQSAIAIWPDDRQIEATHLERLQRYIQKASREAKRRSSWTDPDETYEQALQRSCTLLNGDPLRQRITQLVRGIADRADDVSLAQTALRLLVPGVPDTYQGAEVMRRTCITFAGSIRRSSRPAHMTSSRWAAM